MSVVVWNCHSQPLDVSRNVKLPFLTTRCQYQCEIVSRGDIFERLSGYCILHLIFVTSSDKFWGGIFDTWYGYFIWKCDVNSHLTFVTLSDKYQRCISDSLSGYFIWKMWTHILPLSLHLTSTRDVYLIPDLGTSSENVNSHLTFVTSSDKYQGCISWPG